MVKISHPDGSTQMDDRYANQSGALDQSSVSPFAFRESHVESGLDAKLKLLFMEGRIDCTSYSAIYKFSREVSRKR